MLKFARVDWVSEYDGTIEVHDDDGKLYSGRYRPMDHSYPATPREPDRGSLCVIDCDHIAESEGGNRINEIWYLVTR